MSDFLTLEQESIGLSNRIAELCDALPKDSRVVIKDETRLLTKMVMSLTPPSPGLGSEAKKLGEAAINGDLKKIFTPVTEGFLNFVGSKFGVRNIKATLNSKYKNGVSYDLDWTYLDANGSGMRNFHRSQQNRRGRTKNVNRGGGGKWKAAYVVSQEDLDKYMAHEQSKVGRAKASFAVAFQNLGGKPQRWIARHLTGGAKGFVVNNLNDLNYPSVTVGSRAPGLIQITNVVRQAIRARGEAIEKRIRLVLSGYAKDVAQGIKIQNRERARYST